MPGDNVYGIPPHRACHDERLSRHRSQGAHTTHSRRAVDVQTGRVIYVSCNVPRSTLVLPGISDVNVTDVYVADDITKGWDVLTNQEPESDEDTDAVLLIYRLSVQLQKLDDTMNKNIFMFKMLWYVYIIWLLDAEDAELCDCGGGTLNCCTAREELWTVVLRGEELWPVWFRGKNSDLCDCDRRNSDLCDFEWGTSTCVTAREELWPVWLQSGDSDLCDCGRGTLTCVTAGEELRPVWLRERNFDLCDCWAGTLTFVTAVEELWPVWLREREAVQGPLDVRRGRSSGDAFKRHRRPGL